MFEPLAFQLRKPAAQRLTRKGLLIFAEILCWVLFLTSVIACALLYQLYPFSLLFQTGLSQLVNTVAAKDIQSLQWSIYALIGFCGLTFLLMARSLAGIRQKNDIIHNAGSRIKTLVGQHLQRKVAIDTIEQRHFGDLPIKMNMNVNELPNPGYEG